MKFETKIAKSMFEHRIKNGAVWTDNTTVAMATEKQMGFIGGKSGEFITESGEKILFKPSGGRMFLFYRIS